MFASLLEAARKSPFHGPLTPALCDVNEPAPALTESVQVGYYFSVCKFFVELKDCQPALLLSLTLILFWSYIMLLVTYYWILVSCLYYQKLFLMLYLYQPIQTIVASSDPEQTYSCEFGSAKYFALCGVGGLLSCGKFSF